MEPWRGGSSGDERAYCARPQLWMYNASTQRTSRRFDSASAAERAIAAGNAPLCHHRLLFLSYWPLTGPCLHSTIWFPSFLTIHINCRGALKLSSAASVWEGWRCGGWQWGGERINKVSVLPSISLPQYSALWVPDSKCLSHSTPHPSPAHWF